MRYGRLDRRVSIQRKSSTQSASGHPVETWSTLANVSAYCDPIGGDERFTAPQVAALEQVEFGVRWRSSLADLSPKDRIVYPELEDASPAPSIAGRAVYDVLAVHEVGRRRELRIVAARRPDLSQ